MLPAAGNPTPSVRVVVLFLVIKSVGLLFKTVVTTNYVCSLENASKEAAGTLLKMAQRDQMYSQRRLHFSVREMRR